MAKTTTEYLMVEGNTERIGEILTEAALDGWHPLSTHQSFLQPGSYSKHSILLMRVVHIDSLEKPKTPSTVEYRK